MKLFLFLLRLAFGAVFIWSGIAKLKDPISFAEAVRNFQIVGDPFAPALALFIPWVEVFAGVGVMSDRFVRGGAAILAASLIVFIGAMAIAWARGLDISCGCFGGSGEIDYPVKIAQNLALTAIAAFLWWKATPSNSGNDPNGDLPMPGQP
ncbi:MAG: MauE/DoxX family redox-associated membrane protein [Verrucomicrobiales bacterium]